MSAFRNQNSCCLSRLCLKARQRLTIGITFMKIRTKEPESPRALPQKSIKPRAECGESTCLNARTLIHAASTDARNCAPVFVTVMIFRTVISAKTFCGKEQKLSGKAAIAAIFALCLNPKLKTKPECGVRRQIRDSIWVGNDNAVKSESFISMQVIDTAVTAWVLFYPFGAMLRHV